MDTNATAGGRGAIATYFAHSCDTVMTRRLCRRRCRPCVFAADPVCLRRSSPNP